jgi:hypothetical protein
MGQLSAAFSPPSLKGDAYIVYRIPRCSKVVQSALRYPILAMGSTFNDKMSHVILEPYHLYICSQNDLGNMYKGWFSKICGDQERNDINSFGAIRA